MPQLLHTHGWDFLLTLCVENGTHPTRHDQQLHWRHNTVNHYSHISLIKWNTKLIVKMFIINKMHRIYSSIINKLSLTDVCTIKGLCCRNFRMQFTTLSCPVSLASSIRQSNAMYVPVLPIPALSEGKSLNI